MIVTVGSIGWGDAARTIPIIKRLKTDVTVIGNLNAAEFFKEFGYDCISLKIDYFSRDLSIFKSTLKLVKNLPKILEVKKLLERELEKDKDKILLVVQDFLFSFLVPFLRKKIKMAISISLLPRISSFENVPEELKDQLNLAKIGMKQMEEIFDYIFYDDFKETKGPEFEGKRIKVGIITRDFKKIKSSEEIPVYIMSGWEGSERYLRKILRYLNNVLVVGRKIEGINSVGFVRDIENYISRASFVISTAGMGTIGDSLKLKKPMLLIPIENHIEQYVNAKTIENLGFGKMFRRGKDLEIFLNNLDLYRENIRKKEIDLEGAREISEVINGWLG